MKIRHAKRLMVEGRNDLHSIVGIMREFVNWPDVDEAPVGIEDMGSVEQVLERDAISSRFKSPNVQILGLVIDANTNLAGRYAQFRKTAMEFFPDAPLEPPIDGLVLTDADGKRLGLWIMPDNISPGYLENFLTRLVPQTSQAIWNHSVQSANAARDLGAPFKVNHDAKAYLYTWLAWQDAPGRPPGESIKKGYLDARSPSAARFVAWFMALYQLAPKTM